MNYEKSQTYTADLKNLSIFVICYYDITDCIRKIYYYIQVERFSLLFNSPVS